MPVHDPSAARTVAPDVLATSPGALEAVRGHIVQGRYFDEGHDTRADRVVVLGVDAAERLGVVRVDRQPSIFIGDRAYQVIGIVDDVQRRSDVLSSVLMPEGTARADFGLTTPEELHLHLAVGAGPVVASQLPTALSPNAPETIDVQTPPATSTVQQSVQADVNTIFLALGGVALLIGGVGIANVTLLSVLERVGEIGLRRALGATRRDIGAQFMVESVVVGLLGGMLGAALGVAVVVSVSAAQEWTPILDLRMVGVAALAGGRDRSARRALPVAQGRLDRADRGVAWGRLTRHVLVQGEEHGVGRAVGCGRAGREVVEHRTDPGGQLVQPGAVQTQAQAGGDDVLRVDERDLLEERVDEDPAHAGAARGPPRLAGGPVRDLARPAASAPGGLRDEKASVDEGADVVQDGGGVPVQALGELAVGERVFQAEPQDALPQRAGQGARVGVGPDRVVVGRLRHVLILPQ